MANPRFQSATVDFFGRVSLGNFLDWLVTFCLGAILALSAASLGAVRPGTQLALLPLFIVLLLLHGLWALVNEDRPRRINPVPLWFAPFPVWMALNTVFLSEAPWRGWHSCILAGQVFVVLWVLVNNVRTRAHLWVLLLLALAPAANAVFLGFYQFFQQPGRMADVLGAVDRVRLSPEVLGQAVGSFADPNSFAVYLLVLLPGFVIAGAVPRLTAVLRILCFYIAVMLVASLVFARQFWALLLLAPLCVVTPWLFCEKRVTRLGFALSGLLTLGLVALALFNYYPGFRRGLETALSPEGEGVRLPIWREAARLGMEAPLTGRGAGTFRMAYEQSPRVDVAMAPHTPLNDYLLVFSELGLLGLLLLLIPMVPVFRKVLRFWREEPFRVRLKEKAGWIMPPQKFFIAVGLGGSIAFALCLAMTFVFYVPGLTFLGTLFFGILVKSGFNRTVRLPSSRVAGLLYCAAAVACAAGLQQLSAPRLESAALELTACQQLEHLVAKDVPVSGNPYLLMGVRGRFAAAVEADPGNADAWIGLSAAHCQSVYRDPGAFRRIGEEAVTAAGRAVALSDGYWRAWAQLGVAEALRGAPEASEKALERAVRLAPNNSNAFYYKAAFLSHFPEKQQAAETAVRRALEINPENEAARRLRQKLQVL